MQLKQFVRQILVFLFFTTAAFGQTTYSCPSNQYVTTQLINTGQSCSALPTSVTNDITGLTGDVTATGPGSVAASVVKVNGAALPASTAVVGTNSSGQVVSVPSQTAATVLAAPSGTSGVPTFRVLAPADLPVATTGALGAVKPDGSTITISGGVISSVSGGAGTVTGVSSANANATVSPSTPNPVITINAAPKLATARTINGVSFDGTANITVGVPNTQTAGTGGTTANTFVSIDTSNPSRFVTAASGSCGAGVALASVSSGSTFTLSDAVGIVQVTTDSGGVVAGHLIVGSTVTPGLAMDSGQTSSSNITNGTPVCGTAEATVVGGALVNELPHARGSRGTKIDIINGTSLQGLATGVLKNTSSTGVPSIAVAGTDYQAPITLTTTGTSGAATLSGGTLNVPQYSGGGGGSGTVNAGSQYSLAYYSATGSATTVSGITPAAGVAIYSASAAPAILPVAGSGAAITSGPTSAASNDLAYFTGTAGQLADTGIARTAVAVLNGGSAFTVLQTFNAGFNSVKQPNFTVGTAIASASTIAPTTGIVHITGTTTINTITAPAGMSSTIGGCIVVIADGAWATTTSGNIFAVMTATTGTPYSACYDGSKWYIK